MCTASAALGAQGFGAAATAVGSYYSAQSQRANLGLQATIADINAQTAESTAQQALVSGQRQEQASRLRTANLKGQQTASMAANGIDLGQGSALRVLTDTDTLGQIDANTIKANAVRSAWGYRTQATNYQNQALQARSAASAISPGLTLATSLLGGATQVAGSWYAFNKAGAFAQPKSFGSTLDAFYGGNTGMGD
ncbi:virion core protein, T7 gp14 family [Comamonas sp. C24C]